MYTLYSYPTKGSLQIKYLAKIGNFDQQGGGGVWLNPKFLLKLSKIKFAL